MTDRERGGTVYYDRSTRLTFTLPSPGFSVTLAGPWEVVGRFVVNRDLWIVVTPTDDIYRRPDPEALCAALNRVYTQPTPAAPAPPPSESPTSS
jgi:hypothetical protein